MMATIFGFAATAAKAQQFYLVSKTQVFSQTSSAGSVPNPYGPFVFSVQAATNGTLTLPSGSPAPALTLVTGDNNSYEINQGFATKAALDAAFPSGTYRFTGAGVPTLSFNVLDAYPTTDPSVIGGTWNNGVLVFPANQAATITISTNSSYATAGVAGHMQVKVQSAFDNTVNIRSEIATQPIFGFTSTQTPLTSQSIPANQMVAGRVFQVEVHFDTITSLDTTSVPGGGVVTIFSKTLQFYAVAQGATTPAAPVIISQPSNQTGVVGGSVTIPITVGGSSQSNTSMHWFFNGLDVNPDGAKIVQGPNGLTINNLTAADAGAYSVVVVNAGGLVLSNSATVTLAASAAPTFSQQPPGQTLTVAGGSTVALNAVAVGAPTPTYQWQRDGQAIAGATNSTLILSGTTGVAASISGRYSVVATNASGNLTSTATPLNAINTSLPSRLANLSIRTTAGADAQTLIVGLNVGGNGTSGSKAVLIRAIGPTLAGFGVGGALADPTLTLASSASVTIATNGGWLASDAAVMSSVGAFALTPGSADAAIANPALPNGGYSARVSSKTGATGIVLAEIYDATPGGGFTASTPRLSNVSARAQVGTGDGILIAGFNISGDTAKTVLVRGIGPALTNFGVQGALADPVLKLYDSSGAVVAINDDWGGSAQLNNQSGRVGAFQLTSASSKDAMLLVTLNPGSYTAQVSGAGSSTGVALIEIYEVP